jgi:hypothetical protein
MSGKRFFSEKEIERWNEILQKRNYKYSVSIDIASNKLRFHDRWDTSLLSSGRQENDTDICNKFMNDQQFSSFQYDFSFSVIKKRKNEFFKILDGFIGDGFEIGGYDTSKSFDLKEESHKYSQMDHTVYNSMMVRVTYNWKNPLLAMLLSTIIEDAIGFFGMMWGYTEDGEEKCLVKYPIGSIVSRSSNKGIDYMVNSYDFARVNSYMTYYANKPYVGTNITLDTPTILYDIVCIESDIKSPIIRYGDSCMVSEGDICPSRTNNLNIILN